MSRVVQFPTEDELNATQSYDPAWHADTKEKLEELAKSGAVTGQCRDLDETYWNKTVWVATSDKSDIVLRQVDPVSHSGLSWV